MDAPVNQFPHLDYFLNAYMHQDWRLFGDSLEKVLDAFVDDSSPDDLNSLRAEILEFLVLKGNRVEADYHALYPNSILPSGWGLSVEDWLQQIADAVEKRR